MKPLTIGVTGHRALSNPAACQKSVRHLLQSIQHKLREQIRTYGMVLLSPLAEGADSLVAREWIAFPGFSLDCPLPLELDEYLKDFKTEKSKQEFLELLSRSSNIHVMEKQSSRSAAYKRVGHCVVDRCDLLLAIWNGNAPENEAGTAAIVQYARSVRKPLLWIHAEQPERVTGERVDQLLGENWHST